MGFLKFLLVALVGYYLLVLLGRLLGPWLRAYASRKTEQYFRQAFEQANQSRPEEPREPGEVTIDRPPRKKQRTGQPVGEYIEYEEID